MGRCCKSWRLFLSSIRYSTGCSLPLEFLNITNRVISPTQPLLSPWGQPLAATVDMVAFWRHGGSGFFRVSSLLFCHSQFTNPAVLSFLDRGGMVAANRPDRYLYLAEPQRPWQVEAASLEVKYDMKVQELRPK